ncbi:DUF5104 domain-containing protein [Oceanirhabdus sp. W0125-5]|uniref:DUF5104 domain-containing protein n=1 Tax=Oceanirhabdus sp. W0125-5 TaxID=2999116 RepID=UPI0022F2E41A|nr:DUF5104 domain-containing protein [Oceanirhabdus sp. W0125-5]WBW98150.1 DUF5104 domain-containing protein [Oceanirhabdus sp. W0125-5]
MNKFIISSILILSMLFLSSCSVGCSRTGRLFKDNDDKKAEARLKEVIEALENQDKDALKVVFSEKALDEADDFDDSMDNLFDFFQGEVDSWKKSSGPTVFESNNNGHKIKEVSSYYYVNTDKKKYFFLLEDYPVDTEHPNNVGLYMLLVVKAEDRKKIYDGEQKILFDGRKRIPRVGIYIPFE